MEGIVLSLMKLQQVKLKIIHEDSNVLAIKVTNNNKSYIIIGVYLTCYLDNSSVDKYEYQLSTVSNLIKLYDDEGEILVIGDFQTFPEKIYDHHVRNNNKRNPLSKPLSHFLSINKLELYDVIDGTGPLQTYQHQTLPHSSYIDHIIMYKVCPLRYTICEVHIPNAVNTSDHQPVSITIKYNNNTINQIIESDIREFFLPKVVWKDDAFKQEFQMQVLNNLNSVNFDESDDELDLKTVCKNLVRSATSAYKTCYPERSAHTSFHKTWWTQELSELKQMLSTHFKTWKEHGFPSIEPKHLL